MTSCSRSLVVMALPSTRARVRVPRKAREHEVSQNRVMCEMAQRRHDHVVRLCPLELSSQLVKDTVIAGLVLMKGHGEAEAFRLGEQVKATLHPAYRVVVEIIRDSQVAVDQGLAHTGSSGWKVRLATGEGGDHRRRSDQLTAVLDGRYLQHSEVVRSPTRCGSWWDRRRAPRRLGRAGTTNRIGPAGRVGACLSARWAMEQGQRTLHPH